MRRRGHVAVVAAALGLLAMTQAVPAHAALVAGPATPLGQVAPPPAGCRAPAGTQFQRVSEPTASVDPAPAHAVLVGWQQDPFLHIGVFGLRSAAARSADGGRSFSSATVIDGLTGCAGGSGAVAQPATVITGGTVVTVAKTTDGSTDRIVAVADGVVTTLATASDRYAPDAPAIASDPRRPGRIAVAWTEADLRGKFVPSGDRVRFVLTRDGGRSWSRAATAYAEPLVVLRRDRARPADALPIGDFLQHAMVAIAGDGSVVVGWYAYSPAIELPRPRPFAVPQDLRTSRSADGGRTWSGPVTRARIADDYAISAPDTAQPVEPGLARLAASGATVALVWPDSSRSGAPRVGIVVSQDAGRSFGAPATVALTRTPAFAPAVAVGADGAIAVIWHDFDDDRSGDGRATLRPRLAYGRPGAWTRLDLASRYDLSSFARRDGETAAGEAALGFNAGLVALPAGGFLAAVNAGRELVAQRLAPG